MKQSTEPARRIFRRGDLITFVLELERPEDGDAYLRTTISGAQAVRDEIIENVEHGTPPAGRAWHDVAMSRVSPVRFEARLPLLEVGIFENKCCFQPSDGGKRRWIDGANHSIKVEGADNLGVNTIYTAFVRQFKNSADSAPEAELKKLDELGYTVIPRSGTFRNLIRKLDFIMGGLGSRIIQLLPIHPVPTTYARMGRYGSPFASMDYFSVDPALAEFDPKATVMEQFGELVDAVHSRFGRIFLDIPVNHTGWASKLQLDHPEYFVRKIDGTFVSPGAWGVVWEDLCKLDYNNKHVHTLMAEVFLFWCERGVDGFRCDAGYMLPESAWNYIVAKVRGEYPDTVFMLEGLGGPAAVQERLLGYSGLDWAYSELFQNYSRNEINDYYGYMQQCSSDCGELVNFAETHDNLRLAASGRTYSAMRCALNALLSVNGAFGFANGVEFCATEKIDVHGDSSLNWGAEPNLVPLLRRLHAILTLHPAFWGGASVRLIQKLGGNAVVALRRSAEGETVLAAVNLDDKNPQEAHFLRSDFAVDAPLYDLVGDRTVELTTSRDMVDFQLKPGEAVCLTGDASFRDRLAAFDPKLEPEVLEKQRFRLQALLVWTFFNGQTLDSGVEVDDLVLRLRQSPTEFGRYAAHNLCPAVVRWRDQVDTRRMVMVGEKSLLLVESSFPFRMRLHNGKAGSCYNAKSLPKADGGFFSFARIPRYRGTESRHLALELTRFMPDGRVEKDSGTLLQLPIQEERTMRMEFGAPEIGKALCALHTNDTGGMSQVRAMFGYLNSKYDAVLAANCNSDFPVDRRVMFTRLRAWLVLNDFSQELDVKVLSRFRAGLENRSEWDFVVPMGLGSHVRLTAELRTAENGNAVRWRFIRRAAREESDLQDDIPVRLILRADVEDRVNHELTKAYSGPEVRFPASTRAFANGFDFAPEARKLHVELDGGSFHWEPEWAYMVHLELEQYYGMECKTDLFSPGYFETELTPEHPAGLFAEVVTPDDPAPAEYRWNKSTKLPAAIPVPDGLVKALRHYVVKRDKCSTVIAGYPWFLDWGRDTLIALRGLIKAGFAEESREIIRQFAMFEKQGTIPNMIRGADDSNRETSDAPLWLFVAVRDYIDETGDEAIMHQKCGSRTLSDILKSIVNFYMIGTPNGIHMDADSKLIYSPPHFTWMDTNYPAGTPREGYPIEIQALWFAALDFLGRYEPEFLETALQVRHSVEQFFYLHHLGRFSDCLHSGSSVGAAQAVADDHVRPNQLFALTLGLIDKAHMQSAIVKSSEELIVPGAIRSLADRPVEYHLPILRDGRLLNDPERPYWGRYNGPEDTERKAAYHNGTAWGWPFPSFCEALLICGGESCRPRATRLLLSVCELFNQGSPGQLPEIIEGNAPHLPGGCGAQAWSVSECYRVYELLSGDKHKKSGGQI